MRTALASLLPVTKDVLQCPIALRAPNCATAANANDENLATCSPSNFKSALLGADLSMAGELLLSTISDTEAHIPPSQR
jgi:hypothetical protein